MTNLNHRSSIINFFPPSISITQQFVIHILSLQIKIGFTDKNQLILFIYYTYFDFFKLPPERQFKHYYFNPF